MDTTTAASQHGFRIMVMLYLTPVFPLGPVSYMFGTTSMALSSFATAKIASLPLKLLYSFIGASAGALGKTKDGPDGDEVKDIEENRTFVIAGILFSIVVFSFITHYITKELNKVTRGSRPSARLFHYFLLLLLAAYTHTFLL
jgi:uncharacterized membrane protein YdjX (TVP38/TMEM64 family)